MAEAQEPSAVLMPTEGREPSDRALKPTPAAALEPSAANPTSEAMEPSEPQEPCLTVRMSRALSVPVHSNAGCVKESTSELLAHLSELVNAGRSLFDSSGKG